MIRNIFKKQHALLYRRQQGERTTIMTELPGKEETINLHLKQGDKAPWAYNRYWQFPADYRPETLNYRGDGLFLGAFFGLIFSYIMYERDYLNRTGQIQRDPNKLYYKP